MMKIGILFISGIGTDNDLSSRFRLFTKNTYTEYKELIPWDKNKGISQPLSKRINEAKRTISLWKKSGLKTFVVGHSLGGAIATMAVKNTAVDGLCLWDCSLDPKDIFKNGSLKISKEALEELDSFQALSESFKSFQDKNILFITAGKGGRKLSETYHSITSSSNSRLSVLDQADHNFSDESHREELFRLTVSFFNKITRGL